MLAIFTRMLNTTNVGNSIKRQIIQTMSILVQNITNDTYFYYLLSNNHINEIISIHLIWQMKIYYHIMYHF